MLNKDNKEIIRFHALSELPRESCGLLLKNGDIIKCQNTSPTPEEKFAISKDIIEKYRNDILAVYHSHANDSEFSNADIYICEKIEIPFVLYDCGANIYREYAPKGIVIPYEGRPFLNGVFDCVNLLKEFYSKKLNITIHGEPSHDGRYAYDKWEEMDKHELYLGVEKFLLNNGFVVTNNRKKYDVILMNSRKIKSPINLGIFVEENQILHYFDGWSRKDFYSGYFKKHTHHVYHHPAIL
jgi:proteasome lid subunit RPN8/RPN11